MRKLIVQQWVTVDNIAEGDTSAFKASGIGFIDSIDTMILGANISAQSVGYWPHATEQGEYGAKLNTLTKYVASAMLEHAPLENGVVLLRHALTK